MWASSKYKRYNKRNEKLILASLASLQFASKQSKSQIQKQNASSFMHPFMLVLEYESGRHCEGNLQIFSTNLALICILDGAWNAKIDYLGGWWMELDQKKNTRFQWMSRQQIKLESSWNMHSVDTVS